MNTPDGFNAETITILTVMFLFVSSFLVTNFFQEEAIRFTGKVVYGEEDLDLPPEVIEKIENGEEVNVVATVQTPKNPLWTSSGKLSTQEKQKKAEEQLGRDVVEFPRSEAVSFKLTKDNVDEVVKNPFFSSVHEDIEVTSFLQDSKDVINASDVWNYESGYAGENETVCVIDSGIDYTHPGLGECTKQEVLNGSCQKVLDGYDYFNGDNDPMDVDGHGTHVSGIVAGEQPVRGVAPNASLVALKTLEGGTGTFSDSTKGIEWCTNHKEEYNISAITMSLGTSTTYNSYCDSDNVVFNQMSTAVEDARDKNISVMVATGNGGDYSGISSPACLEPVMRVTATNDDDVYASFANRGSFFNETFTAPGVAIDSLALGSGTTSKSGTSMSTPHVAGSVALLQSYLEDKNGEQNQSEMYKKLESEGKDVYDSESGENYTRINVYESILNKSEANLQKLNISVSVQNATIQKLANQTISWNTSGENVTNVTVNVTNPVNNTIFETNATNGSKKLNGTKHNVTGRYTFTYSATNSANQTDLGNETYAVKTNQSYNFTINDEKNQTLINEDNVSLTINQTSGSQTYTLIKSNNTTVINTSFYQENISIPYGNTTYTINATNKTKYFNYTETIHVTNINGSITIHGYHPNTTYLERKENDSIDFSVNATNPINTSMTENYTVDDTYESNTSFTLQTNLRYGNHTVKYTADNNESTKNVTWTVHVNPAPPVIENVSPNGDVVVRKNKTQRFNQTNTDPMNRTTYQRWWFGNITYLNGTNTTITKNNETVSENTTYTLRSHNISKGNYTLNLDVYVNESNISNAAESWNISIKDPLQNVSFTTNISDISINEDQSKTIDTQDYFTWDEQDTVNISVHADRVGYSVDGTEVTFQGDPSDELVNISVIGLETNARSNTFDVSIKEVEEEESTSSGGGGGGFGSPTTEETEEENTSETTDENETSITDVNDTESDLEKQNRTVSENTFTSDSVENETDHTIKTETNIQEIRVTTKTPKNRVEASVKEITNTSETPTFPRTSYKTFEINISETNASITFSTEKSWHTANNISRNQTALFRYNGSWNQQPTTYNYSNTTHNIYEADVRRFSTFTIGERAEPETQTPQPTRNDSSYFPIIIGLLFIAFIGVSVYEVERYQT